MIPNIIVLGVGHTGTRFVVNIFRYLGWDAGNVDIHSEIPAIIRINEQETFDVQSAKAILASLREPYIIKDPRFVTLNRFSDWLQIVSNPFVLHVTRDIDAIHQSHVRRNEDVSKQEISRLLEHSRHLYDSHNGPKFSVDFAQICAIIESYDPQNKMGLR